jgi:hypothetical protein
VFTNQFSVVEDAKVSGLLRRGAGSSGRTPVLEAFPAVYRAPLGGLEGNGRLFPALRADRFGLYALYASGTVLSSLCAICFAGLATFGLVLESLVREEHLLAGRENELRSTIGALQDLVMVFHTLLRGLVRSGQASAQLAAGGRTSFRAYWRPCFARWLEADQNDWSDAVA